MRPKAETLLGATLLLLLLWLVVIPAVSVLIAGAEVRALGRVLSGAEILGNTVLVGACTMLGALALGAALVLGPVRIDTPGRHVLEPLILLPFYITPLLTAIAWSWLGSPRSGLLTCSRRSCWAGRSWTRTGRQA